PKRRAMRLHEAALAAWVAGRPGRAAGLAEAVTRSTEDPLLRADAALLWARVEWNTGSAQVACRRLLQEAAAVAPRDTGRAREMAMFAASVIAAMPAGPDGTDPRSLAGEPRTGRDRLVWEVLHAFTHISRREWAEAAAAVRRAEPLVA